MSHAEQLRRWAPGSWRHHLHHAYADRPRAEMWDARSRAARVVLRDLAPRVGEAWFPAVSPADAVSRTEVPGLVVRVRVGVGARRLDPDVAARAAGWVAGLVGADHLDAPALFLDELPPGWEIAGRSCELAAAVALLSHLVGSPPRQPLLLSAALGDAGVLEPVAHLDAKAEIARREAPGATRCFVDGATSAPLDAWFARGWRQDLAQVLGRSPSGASRRLRAALEQGDRPAAVQHARLALASPEPSCQAEAHRALGADALHRGDTARGLDHLRRAGTLLQRHGQAHRFQAEELDAHVGIALLDALDPVGAVAVLRPTLDRLAAVPDGDRFERWRQVALQVAGSLRRSLVALDRLDEARDLQLAWGLGAADVPTERSRCELDLADVLLRLGHSDAARAALDRARRHLADAWLEARPLTLRFLRLQEQRAGTGSPSALPPGTSPDWDDWPQPLELASHIAALPGAEVEAALDHWPHPERPVLRWVTSAVAAELTAAHGLLPWCARAFQAVRPLVSDDRMGPGAEEALAAARDGHAAAWRRRVPY